jgi:hypothetical protein
MHVSPLNSRLGGAKLATLGIFGSYAPGFGTRDAAERDVDMFFFQRDGRMSRILTIGASIVQHKLDQIAKRGSA